MKSILILILVSILSANAYAQKKMTPRELVGFKGNVKTVKEEVTLLRLNEEKYNSSERIPEYEFYFDKDGNVTGDPQKPGSRYRLEYINDSEDRISEERMFDETGFQFSVTKFKYNSNRQVLEKNWFYKGKNTANHYYSYDDEGNLAAEIYTTTRELPYQNIKILRYKDYKFDATGNWIQSTVTSTAIYAGMVTETVKIYYRKIEYYK